MPVTGRDVLVFEVAGRRFGLPVPCVRELVRAVTVVAVPGLPAAVEGVIDLRGRVVPVLDLRGYLGLPPRGVVPDDVLIITEPSGGPLALRVDRALDLAAAPEGTGVLADPSGGLAPVLDVEQFLSATQAEATRAVLTGPAGVGP